MKLSEQPNKYKKKTNIIPKELIEVFNILENNQDKFETYITKWNTKRIIIPNNIVNKIKTKLKIEKIPDSIKEKIKNYIRKLKILHKQDAIIFAKGKIYIIQFKHNEKRFKGLSPEDAEFLLKEFIDKGYNTEDIINKVISKCELTKKKEKEIINFIQNHKKIILQKFTEVLKEIIPFDIEDRIIEGIAGKIFRENYVKILKKITEIILPKLLNQIYIFQIIEYSIIEALRVLEDFKKDKNYLEINENLSGLFYNKIIENIHSFLNKKNIFIGKNFLQNSFTVKLIKDYSPLLFKKLSEKIIETLKNNPTKETEENILRFLSYYSGEIKIINGKKYQYPKWEITPSKLSFINQVKNSKDHPYIENLANQLSKRKQLINQ